MIVAGPEGFLKNAYRKFSIRGDGAAPTRHSRSRRATTTRMMREVLTRRFARALKEDPTRESGTWPDLVLLDGGEAQLAVAEQVLADLGIADIPLVAIAKGPDRDAGRERFFQPGKPPKGLDPKSPVLYYLQRLRDEAHRFAIGTHRARRAKAISALAAGRDLRHRRAAQEGAPASFRLGARRVPRGSRRPRAGRRHQQNRGKKDL